MPTDVEAKIEAAAKKAGISPALMVNLRQFYAAYWPKLSDEHEKLAAFHAALFDTQAGKKQK